MAKFIDLNADMGESYGRWTLGADEEIMPNITSANVACGFHGGDPHVMRKTVELALRHGVAIGSRDGRVAAGVEGLPLLPDRRAPRVRPRLGRRAPAHQAPRHPLFDDREGRAARHRGGRVGPRVRARPDPDGAGVREVRPDRPQDGCARGLRGIRRPRVQRRPHPGLAQAPRLAHHRSRAGGRPGGEDGHGRQGAHDRRRRDRHRGPDHLLPR